MSHSASPRHDGSVPDSDGLVDLLADVSHHGSSLFEFFSLPSSSLESTPFVSQPSLTYDSQSNVNILTSSPFPLPNSSSPQPQFHHANIPQISTSSSLKSPRQNLKSGISHTPPISKRRKAVSVRTSTQNPSTRNLQDDSSSNDSDASVQPDSEQISANPSNLSNPPQTSTLHQKQLGQPIKSSQPRSPSTPTSSLPPVPRPSTTTATPTITATLSASHSNGDLSSIAVTDGPLRQTHNSHTRRCRAKVNSKFQELLSILPPPPQDVATKHKAQILDYTIRVLRDFHARKTMLEAELALSSKDRLHTWVQNIISRSLSLHDLLNTYLTLVCTKGNWKYSEAWVSCNESPPPPRPTSNASQQNDESPHPNPHLAVEDTSVTANLKFIKGPHSRLRLGVAVIPSLGNTDDPDLRTKLERFRDKSRPYGCKPRVDLPGRIVCTMRPEWLPALKDTDVFQRSHLAQDASLATCFGVPLFVRGHVVAVAMFFDTEQRPYDAKSVDLAEHVALLLGTSYGNALEAASRRGVQGIPKLS